jgi:hypothetical protein
MRMGRNDWLNFLVIMEGYIAMEFEDLLGGGMPSGSALLYDDTRQDFMT